MNLSVLLIDDDVKLGQLMTQYFSGFDISVQSTASPADALRRLQISAPDVVVLDVMLPEMDGFETCRRIRQFSSVPIIMLTARGELSDRVLGLETGCDDYLPKPFEPRELVARVKALARRGAAVNDVGSAQSTGRQLLQIGSLTLDRGRFTASLDARNLELTTLEFELLQLFMENAHQVLNRDQIMLRLRNDDYGQFDRSIDVLISRLRTRLGDDPRAPKFIRTVRGAGYVFFYDGEQT